MNEFTRLRILRVLLILFGLMFIFGLYPLMKLWPEGFGWTPSQPEYEQMILGIYATLGVFLLFASRNPYKHLSLIWFASISSIVHGLIMLIQALVDKTEVANLYGDIPAILLVGILLAIFTPIKRPKKSEILPGDQG